MISIGKEADKLPFNLYQGSSSCPVCREEFQDGERVLEVSDGTWSRDEDAWEGDSDYYYTSGRVHARCIVAKAMGNVETSNQPPDDEIHEGHNITELAMQFCKVLRSWLSPREMAEVNRRNARETAKRVCHSHDFCDSNMAMHEVFVDEKNDLPMPVNEEDEAEAERGCNLWNRIWDNAVAHYFY